MKNHNTPRVSRVTAPASAVFSALAVALVLAAGAGAGGCVSVDADIPNVEVTQKGLTFAGVPVGSALGDVSMTRSFSQEHSALDLPEGLTSEVKALEVSLTAKQGISDFGFVRYLRLTMSDTSDNSNALELINYERDPAVPAGLPGPEDPSLQPDSVDPGEDPGESGGGG